MNKEPNRRWQVYWNARSQEVAIPASLLGTAIGLIAMFTPIIIYFCGGTA